MFRAGEPWHACRVKAAKGKTKGPRSSKARPAAKAKAKPKAKGTATSATRGPARKAGAPAASRPAMPRKPATKTASAGDSTAPVKWATRADLGQPIDGFFLKQPPALRAILEELRQLVEETVPDAASS